VGVEPRRRQLRWPLLDKLSEWGGKGFYGETREQDALLGADTVCREGGSSLSGPALRHASLEHGVHTLFTDNKTTVLVTCMRYNAGANTNSPPKVWSNFSIWGGGAFLPLPLTQQHVCSFPNDAFNGSMQRGVILKMRRKGVKCRPHLSWPIAELA
jgi:hypothetical protein